ncbi:transposase [sulfur-oxidizing endosymbiont of Gigantopelta aegis]|uniref:transposase n=1 Tax=sulfur-oxidizing endosymbiont of Gigantopelta aegis TaxID=2794934 RepID=UPI001FE7038B|nr:transposase [sulfur-oxidizing endosymbiont of Gigantopelta aegis]
MSTEAAPEVVVQKIKHRSLQPFLLMKMDTIAMNLNVLKGFKSSEIKRWAQTHLTPGSTVYSDGLNCFPAVKEADCKHVPIVTGGGAAIVDKIEFIWVNI